MVNIDASFIDVVSGIRIISISCSDEKDMENNENCKIMTLMFFFKIFFLVSIVVQDLAILLLYSYVERVEVEKLGCFGYFDHCVSLGGGGLKRHFEGLNVIVTFGNTPK